MEPISVIYSYASDKHHVSEARSLVVESWDCACPKNQMNLEGNVKDGGTIYGLCLSDMYLRLWCERLRIKLAELDSFETKINCAIVQQFNEESEVYLCISRCCETKWSADGLSNQTTVMAYTVSVTCITNVDYAHVLFRCVIYKRQYFSMSI